LKWGKRENAGHGGTREADPEARLGGGNKKNMETRPGLPVGLGGGGTTTNKLGGRQHWSRHKLGHTEARGQRTRRDQMKEIRPKRGEGWVPSQKKGIARGIVGTSQAIENGGIRADRKRDEGGRATTKAKVGGGMTGNWDVGKQN